MSYGAMRRTDLAVENFRQAVRLQPAKPQFHFHLALAYNMSGNKDLAWQEYRTLGSLDANLAEKLKEVLNR
jgi:Flp pilus assembly protein TadD